MEIINKKRFIFFSSGLIFFVLLLIGASFFIYYQIKTPWTVKGMDMDFVVEQGEGLKEIAANLEQVGLIRNKTWFMTYIFYKGWAAQLQAGEYSLNPTWSISQIARKIVKGKIISSEVLITIPEGFTLKQIDARLANAELIELDELAKQSELEGYLFPDTYEFNKDVDLEEIIKIMRENFDIKLNEELRQEITRQGKTIEQIIIMASLLEKEVSSYSDRQIVSGIFNKRIKDSYPLQADASLSYIFEDNKPSHSIKETKVDSLYNTYQNIGLPPGPISNPGLLAIKAAIYPQESDYYFFLSKPDGETVFSKTLEEHNENKAKYLN